MSHSRILICFLLWGTVSCSLSRHGSVYIELFDGSSLAGWKGDESLWSVQDGAIVGEVKPGKELKRNSFIIWQGGIVKDFELIAEYKVSDAGNSGFNYRSEEVAGQPFAMRGYQADI